MGVGKGMREVGVRMGMRGVGVGVRVMWMLLRLMLVGLVVQLQLQLEVEVALTEGKTVRSASAATARMTERKQHPLRRLL